MPTTMHAELSLFSEDLDPERIADLLGIPADEEWRKGDPKGARAVAFRKEGCWRIVTVPSEDCDRSLNDHLRDLLERIKPVRESLSTLAEGCSVEFGAVIEFDETVPDLHVDADVVKAMAQMNAELDLDIYL